jgi:hypothetical protein
MGVVNISAAPSSALIISTGIPVPGSSSENLLKSREGRVILVIGTA